MITGRGKLLSLSEVSVESEEVESRVVKARRIILATGSRPKKPAAMVEDREGIITAEEGLSLSGIPESLVVLGGQEIGFSVATVFSKLGAKVTGVPPQGQ